MRGASALEDVLDDHPGERIRTFLVWEPVIWTDLGPPRDAVLAEVQDARARQFWDPGKLLSKAWIASTQADPTAWQLEEGLPSDMVVWDLVALYRPGARWEAHLPVPEFVGYPVVEHIDDFRGKLEALAGP